MSFDFIFQLLYFVLVAGITEAQSRPGGSWVLLERVNVPDGWIQGRIVDPSTMFSMKINLNTASQTEDLHQKVMEIGTPGHARYGLHLKQEEINSLMTPNEVVLNDVLKWIQDGGVGLEHVRTRANWIDIELTIGAASKMLNARFYEYKDERTGLTKIRTTEYSAPKSVAQHIFYIYPLILFTRTAAQNKQVARSFLQDLPSRGTVSAACPEGNTPNCLRGLYNLGNITAKAGSRNKIAVSGYLDQYAQYKDLAAFLQKFAPQAASANFSVSLVKGGQNIQNSTRNSIEANLDTQYAVALTYNMKVDFVSVKGRGLLKEDLDQPNQSKNQNEPYMDQLEYLMGLPDKDLPTVLTTSYGETEQSVPELYARATCNEFAKLTARGVSIIFSSGDTGVGSACTSNDGKNRTVFNPIFPASCPFVTAVGGTHSRNPERAVGFSAGGFSNYFKRPGWQDEAVTKYLSNLGTTWEGYYNPLGRGFPDVAAQAVKYPIYEKGSIITAAGTSASAPTIAAIIAHLNEVRLSQGKPVLGFLNPWIYSTGFKGFTDITHEGSIGCLGTSMYSKLSTRLVPYASWNATKGWDPVTGFGTPDFKKLVKLLP
ncbi:hypothetical protein D8B26_005045 [Coccidioides posadasii str. Silveira]|uniref:tripeptidyl-peptidase II n=1 Tax=Coccidioides posadasii (strain RMSCC 757 / Silveira) TaxID=443226 RepID=E9D5L3_COCPS|nr:conserved hypothetical protein [Coccidioides posadasii str. Silveira]QVM10384.1 hypothetical protein D8B26_005045 [Coccidioides posadasii str. Silveira]